MDVAHTTPSTERVFFIITDTKGNRKLHTLSEPVHIATPVSESEKYITVKQPVEGIFDRICNYLSC